MPAALTYPGVYIEEVPSEVRTIVGVPTSITAFLGRAARGPLSAPTTVNSFGEFVRAFGGLDPAYPLGYAVRDFYVNGGSQALIVRLGRGADGAATLTLDTLKLQAASPGAWGNNLYAAVDSDGISDEVGKRYNLPAGDLFNLSIVEIADGAPVRAERFLGVTCNKDGGARRVDRALAAQSALARLAGDLPAAKPKDSDEYKPPQQGAAGGPAAGAPPAAGGPPAAGEPPAAAPPAAAAGAPAPPAVAAPAAPPPTIVTSTGRRLLLAKADKDSGKDPGALGDADYTGDPNQKTGLYALDKADLFNLLCIPADTRDGDISPAVYQAAMAYCAGRRALLIVDPPAGWGAQPETAAATARSKLGDLGLNGEQARNAALYFPRVRQADPAREGQLDTFVPCGIIAGVMARTDVTRGVWKAPAGLDAALNGVQGLEVTLTDAENGMLNPLGINCLRTFPITGTVAWGARTLRGADQLADPYKYVPVRRLALFLEESLYRGTQWAVFEPNDEPLWSQLRLNVGAFMHNLFRQGAFQGTTPRDAYFVKCDKDTTTQNDIDLGIVNVVVGFAPLKPAEFVVIQIQQITPELAV